MFSFLPINRFRGKKPETGRPSKALFVTHLLPRGHNPTTGADGQFYKLFIIRSLFGGDEGIRTLDLLSAIQALFRAELRPHPREGYCTTANRRMLTSS